VQQVFLLKLAAPKQVSLHCLPERDSSSCGSEQNIAGNNFSQPADGKNCPSQFAGRLEDIMTKDERAYETYCAFCTRIGVMPADFDIWRLLTK
jgi:hypothetical protein